MPAGDSAAGLMSTSRGTVGKAAREVRQVGVRGRVPLWVIGVPLQIISFDTHAKAANLLSVNNDKK